MASCLSWSYEFRSHWQAWQKHLPILPSGARSTPQLIHVPLDRALSRHRARAFFIDSSRLTFTSYKKGPLRGLVLVCLLFGVLPWIPEWLGFQRNQGRLILCPWERGLDPAGKV